MPYIFLKEENQGNEDLVKIGDCQNRKNNLSKLTGNRAGSIMALLQHIYGERGLWKAVITYS
jgi:hypothetical protein